jgi:hypothetical protein
MFKDSCGLGNSHVAAYLITQSLIPCLQGARSVCSHDHRHHTRLPNSLGLRPELAESLKVFKYFPAGIGRTRHEL